MSALTSKNVPARPASRRQSHRVKKPSARANGSNSHLPTPRPSASPSPANSRPATPVMTSTQNRICSTPIAAAYTVPYGGSAAAAAGAGPVAGPVAGPGASSTTTTSSSSSPLKPTVNWDCVTHVISDQKVQSTFEKPTLAPGTTQVTAFGRIITTTTTTTVTTTIATTEILHPGEAGYDASLERQRAQMEANPKEREQIEKRYRESRAWASGDRAGHDCFHQHHSRAGKPVKPVFAKA